MRSFTYLATLVGVAAVVAAQTIDLEYVNSLPDPTYTIIPGLTKQTVTYNEDAAIASAAALATATPVDARKKRSFFAGALEERDLEGEFEKRADCGPVPTTPNQYNAIIDPAESFLSDQNLANVALSAATPSGFARTFQNLKAASQANGYLGYILLSSYNTQQCANECVVTNGCQAFNIYFQRDPSVNPNSNTCGNPPGTANIYCVFWGGPVATENAKNVGQMRWNFRIAITGSNGYVLTDNVQALSVKAINAPLDCNNNDSYMGMRLFNDNGPFDTQRCAALCDATSAYNIQHTPSWQTPGPKICRFYNTYILSKNGTSQGQVCAMYTQYWDPNRYATNTGQYDSAGVRYTISSSYFGYNATDTLLNPICPTNITSLQSDANANEFCTSYIAYSAPTTTKYSYTSKQGCPGYNKAKRSDVPAAPPPALADPTVLEAVVAVYPTPTNPPDSALEPLALITIPGASLDQPGVYASATSAALEGVSSSPAASASTPGPDLARRAATTPPIFAGRDFREVSSACSKVATGTSTYTAPLQTETVYLPCLSANLTSACPVGGATVFAGAKTGGAPETIYASYWKVDLPFTVCMYGACGRTVYPGSSGVVGVMEGGVSSGYNTRLPAYKGKPFLYAFWDQMAIFKGRNHYMSYSTCGPVGRRAVTFEFSLGMVDNGGYYYGRLIDWYFTVTFYEEYFGRAVIKYGTVNDYAWSATIGQEGSRSWSSDGTPVFREWSYNRGGAVYSGDTLVFSSWWGDSVTRP